MTSTCTVSPDAATDLHMHTRYSDGTWLPVQLLDTLAQRGFRVVSVADHDQMDHLPEVSALGESRGLIVVPGTEVTTEWRGLAAHLLCYAPVSTGFIGGALSGLVDDTRARMRANTRLVYENIIAQGYAFPRERELLEGKGGQLQRAMDVGELLIAHGYAADHAEAHRMIAAAGYQQALAPIGLVVEAAHASGAICVLAHPGRGEGEIHRYEPDEIEALLTDVPLDGIEAYYPTHSAEQVAAYEALTRRHGLLVGAGSDSHGPERRAPIATPAARIAPLLERLGIGVA